MTERSAGLVWTTDSLTYCTSLNPIGGLSLTTLHYIWLVYYKLMDKKKKRVCRRTRLVNNPNTQPKREKPSTKFWTIGENEFLFPLLGRLFSIGVLKFAIGKGFAFLGVLG